MTEATKQAIRDYLEFMASSGKLNEDERGRLRKALENNNEKTRKNMPQVFLTRKEAAKMLKVSTRNLDRIRERGEIKYRRIGFRRIRFTLKDLMEYVASVGE